MSLVRVVRLWATNLLTAVSAVDEVDQRGTEIPALAGELAADRERGWR